MRILKDGRAPVGEPVNLSLRASLQRGVEALHWRSFIAGNRSIQEPIRVSPRWSDLGEPFVEAILLESGTITVEMPTKRLFAAAAHRERNRLVASKVLELEASYGFVIAAHPANESSSAPVFHLDEYPVTDDCVEADGESFDADCAHPNEHTVCVSRIVLEDAMRLADQAGDNEAGGVLFGKLHRESMGSGAILEVTHLCPACGGRGGEASFTFTPETWSLAQAVLTERASGEIMVGSYHSHPDFFKCKNCEPARQQLCGTRKPFFSEDDVRLHETVFPAAFSVGFLVSHDGTGYIPSLWGWHDGFINRRSYRLK